MKKKLIPYSNKLPKRSRRKRCQALDNDGNRCRKMAVLETRIFNDAEIRFDDEPYWVRVHLCEEHAPETDLKAIRCS